MSLEIQATYEDGVLKLDKPLPLEEHARVTVTVTASGGTIGESAGLLRWPGSPEDLDYLLGRENAPGEK